MVFIALLYLQAILGAFQGAVMVLLAV